MSRLTTLKKGVWSGSGFIIAYTVNVVEPFFHESDLYYRLHPYTNEKIEELYHVSTKNNHRHDD